MKKILLVAALATLIAAGCEKTEVINPTLGTEMSFSPKMGKLTKANDDGMTNLQQQGFKVTAINAYEDIYTTTKDEFNSIYDGINNTAFTYTNDAWGTDKSYYWPGTDKDLVFLAISSAKDGNTIPSVTIDGREGENGLYTDVIINPFTIEDFEVDAPAAAVDQTPAVEPNNDLMIADVVKQNQGDNNKVVDLHFRHTLSKVQFLFITNAQNGGNTEQYPKLQLSVDKAAIAADGTEAATFTVTYYENAEAQGENETANATIASKDENVPLTNGTSFTGTDQLVGSHVFTATYVKDQTTYTSNEVTVTVGNPTSSVVAERTANEEITVTVKSISVADIVSKGDLKVTPVWEEGSLKTAYYFNQDGKTDTFAWTPSAEDKEVYAVTKDLTLDTEAEIYATWLVIPQEINNLKVTINYTITTGNESRNFQSIFPLYTDQLTKWNVNQYIKYTINLSPNLITFNPSVGDWDTPTDVGHNN